MVTSCLLGFTSFCYVFTTSAQSLLVFATLLLVVCYAFTRFYYSETLNNRTGGPNNSYGNGPGGTGTGFVVPGAVFCILVAVWLATTVTFACFTAFYRFLVKSCAG